MVVLVKPSKRGYFDHKQGAFEVMVWTEAGFPGEANPSFSLPSKGDGRSYLAMESPFFPAASHITSHFGLYLYQCLYQLFLRCIIPYSSL